MTVSRTQWVRGLAGLVIVGLIGYGVWLVGQPDDKYQGLVLETPIELDEATREYFEQRLAITQASIQAAMAAGEEVNLNLYLGAASDAYLLGDLVTAREMLELQLAGNAINHVAWNNYALVLETMEDYVNAELAFRRTLEVETGINKYYVDYADFLVEHFPERRDDLKAVIETNLELGGQTAWNMVALAKWYAVGGQCDKALDHYKVAVVLDPVQALKDDMATLKQTCQSQD